jgi:hypothetical protein
MKNEFSKFHFAILLGIAIAFAATAFAEVPAASPTLVAQPAAVPAIDGDAVGIVHRLAGGVAPEWLIAILAFGLELVGRLLKTSKPWSLLYFMRDLCVALAGFFATLGRQGDRVLQRTKEPGSAIPKV